MAVKHDAGADDTGPGGGGVRVIGVCACMSNMHCII